MSSRKRIVICGGGTIGAAIAYFTSRRGARPILIGLEDHGLCSCPIGASG
jgi:glycine/D-amino acid oxidase-like deaminating enzyme